MTSTTASSYNGSAAYPPTRPSILSTSTRASSNREETGSLRLPRLLCLHGGGTNANIFRAQCRTIETHIRGHFRLVYADAPFLSGPGPDVTSVYGDWGPFRSWIPPSLFGKPKIELDDATITAINGQVRDCLEADNEAGATGPIVGVLGFSQGAKMAASLLYRQQSSGSVEGMTLHFAILMAGRPPVLSLDTHDASPQISKNSGEPYILHMPTLHVHGLQDPGLELHRGLLHETCEEGTTDLWEWQGAHRLPFRNPDVAVFVEKTLRMARKAGCYLPADEAAV